MDFTTHISKIIQYLSFCDWVIFLCILSSEFIHVAACMQNPPLLFFFLKLKNIPLYVQTTFHSSTHKLGHSYLSATVNNADISIGVQVSF